MFSRPLMDRDTEGYVCSGLLPKEDLTILGNSLNKKTCGIYTYFQC